MISQPPFFLNQKRLIPLVPASRFSSLRCPKVRLRCFLILRISFSIVLRKSGRRLGYRLKGLDESEKEALQENGIRRAIGSGIFLSLSLL